MIVLVPAAEEPEEGDEEYPGIDPMEYDTVRSEAHANVISVPGAADFVLLFHVTDQEEISDESPDSLKMYEYEAKYGVELKEFEEG